MYSRGVKNKRLWRLVAGDCNKHQALVKPVIPYSR